MLCSVEYSVPVHYGVIMGDLNDTLEREKKAGKSVLGDLDLGPLSEREQVQVHFTGHQTLEVIDIFIVKR